MSHQYQICYIYIYKYHFLEDLDITFDPHYKFKLNKKEKTLKISKNSDFPESFWGKGIYSISGILGDNGSGKSTIISFLLEALIEGKGHKDINALIVYNNNHQLRVYNHGDIKVNFEGKELHDKEKLWKINTFYFSPYFNPDFLLSYDKTGNFAGSYNASLTSLLRTDLENHLNQPSIYLNQPFGIYINSNVIENNHRICQMLTDSEIRQLLSGFCIPKYITIGLNNSGWNALNITNTNKEYDKILKYQFICHIPALKFQEEMIYYNIINISYEFKLEVSLVNQIIGNWQQSIITRGNLFKQFQKWVNSFAFKDDSLKYYFSDLAECLIKLNEITNNSTNSFKDFYFLNINEDFDKIQEINKLSYNSHFTTSRYFDLHYAQSISDGHITYLSSGELDLLNFYSRIYEAVYTRPIEVANIEAPTLLIIDEGENSFHPEWQRKYINLLVSFLKKLKVPAGHTFQVILTSHSPMILSDFPSEAVNYMKKINGKITNQGNNMTCTFAQNVFELYNNSFFMQNGLIGEFAKKKLQLIEENLLNHKKKNILKEIKLIGDERIKNYLLGLYYKDDSSKMIEYYEEQIRVLKGRKDKKNE